MTNTTSLVEVTAKYKNTGAHLLLPVAGEIQLNPFYKYSVMEVTADTGNNSGDIFKVGSIKEGDSYVEVFSPAKPLLMKLSAAAGIQFDPAHTYGEYITKNCYKAKAYGAIRLPDGTGKTHADEKVINLDDEEDRFRLEFMDKSIEGIMEEKSAEEAAKLFKGEWFEAINKWKKKVKAYRIANEDRQKYIDRSVLVNMTLLRKNFAEKAMTGAILRVVRALIGMKGTYTKAELQKPFVVPRVTFSPDYNDPVVRQAMLEQGMNSVANMFGANRSIMAPPAPILEMPVSPIRDNFDPEDFGDNPAFAPNQPNQPNDDFSGDYQNMPPSQPNNFPDEPSGGNNPNVCHDCGEAISDNVSDFSIKKFNRPLCMKCQKGGGK